MNTIPQPVMEALLVGMFLMLSVALSYNFRHFRLSNMNEIQDKVTLCLIVFWITLNCSILGYVASKFNGFPIQLGIFGGIVLTGILLIISIKAEDIELCL